ncbi:MAG TPA: ATP-binding cassette domain-containing protein [Terriglobia bacterium]|jgi:ABC-2 type transport system ATP-binding protein|nr:ATP-binding cassette domain-containing protein [Terriglobia bacterium]
MDAVTLEQVTKRYDSFDAVSGLSFGIKEGSVFGLLGPNGAGKTTTLRMIVRILLPDEGSVRVFGQPLSDRTQDLIGYLPEERGLYRRMRALEVLRFLGALKGLPEAEAERRALEWLERLGLATRMNDEVNDLSRGMQQKIQFIAAIIHKPPLVILDEPFTGLDPVNAQVVKDVMLELRKDGATIILSTHRMDQVEQMCDSICLMNKGHKILDGDLKAIKKSYGTNTVRVEFVGNPAFMQLPDVIERVNSFGEMVELRLRPGADAQQILRSAIDHRVEIRRFELIEPPLNDIFIEKVSGRDA